MHKSLTLIVTGATVIVATYAVLAALPLSTTVAVTQNFDGIGTVANASLPADFRVDKPTTVRTVGTFSSALTATGLLGGPNLSSTASNGIYNFGAGTTTTGPDRAVGFLSSGTATQSGNLYAQFMNSTGAPLTGLKITYDIEKYRTGSNPAGFCIQLYYSSDGTVWTSAGTGFLTTFAADAGTNTGYSPAPGPTVTVNGTLPVAIGDATSFYLAWNYSVCSGTTTTNGQALAIDNISVLGLSNAPTNPTGVYTANPNSVQAGTATTLQVQVTSGTNPPSQNISVTSDLTTIGIPGVQTFTAGANNVFTFNANVQSSVTPANYTLSATVSDTNPEHTSTTAPLTLAVSPSSTSPTGVGSANPTSLHVGESALLKVTVTPGANPTSTGIAVSANLTAIGGSASQPFTLASGSDYTFTATVAPGTTAGAKSLSVAVSDDRSRSSMTTISLTVLPPPPPTTVKISQVYAGGGNSGATYTNDFVELFNDAATAIDVTGWSVQYNSAGSTTGSWQVNEICPGGPCLIQPNHYFLVELAQGANGTTPLPVPNAVGTTNMGAGSGKVALMNTNAAIAGQCPATGTFVDLVGYGTANCAEASATPVLGNTTAAIRRGNGCQDTDNNSADFVATSPIPRNSLAPPQTCGGDPTQPSGLGIAVPDSVLPASNTLLTVNVTPAMAPPSTAITVVGDLRNIDGSATQTFYDDGTHGDQFAGDNVFSFEATVGAAAATGVKYLVATVADEARSVNVPITMTVESPTCGVVRWVVKVGADSTVGLVRLDLPPTPAAIADLGAIVPPIQETSPGSGSFGPVYDVSRAAPVETTVYQIDGTMTFYKLETDVDYHIVIDDGHQHTIITEIPNPACILAPNPNGPGRVLVDSPLAAGIASAREKFDARLQAQTFFQTANLPVRIKGVGFFDFEHGQTGVAPNAIELHPILDIFFRANTTTTLISSGMPTYGQPLTFTATVTNGGGPTPTGNLTFFYDGNSVVVPLDDNGKASFSTASLPAGDYSMTASYEGDDNSVTSISQPLAFSVARADQSIDFAPLPAKTYGDGDFGVSAGASSGLPVSFSIASGPATIKGATVHLTGAGPVDVRASQGESDNYNSAPDVDRTFDVAPAPLVVKVENKTVEFGSPFPAFTGTLTGVVGADGITASFSPAATSMSPVGQYAIVPVLADPNTRLANYAITSINGILTIIDTTPPAISSVSPSVTSIWPPNKKMIPVAIAVAAHDAADPAPTCSIVGVSANEGTSADWAITGPLSVNLRADRDGSGGGRIYTITVKCTDASGNASTATTTVLVPHDQGK